jgi:DHA2 family multidrug resistance protein-like MFS transporter
MAKKQRKLATSREWIGLVVIALACLLYSMDLTVLNLAVPKITEDLQPSSAQLLWIVDIYGFFVAGSLITMGTLGDRIGRRRLLMIGAAAFGVTSVLASLAHTAPSLIAARALLGVAGATLAPSTLSLIRNMFHDEKQRNTAIGTWGASFAAGGLIGPVVGGLVLEHFTWNSVFLVSVPIMILLLVLGPRLLPEYKDPKPGKLDLVSAAMSVVAVLSVIYGLKVIAQDGFSAFPAASIVLGLSIAALFVRRQLAARRDPFIDVNLFKVPAFSVSVATNLLTISVMFGSFLFLGQFMQLVLGLSPLTAGLYLLPSGVAAVAGSLLTPVVVNRVRPIVAMLAGFFFMSVGFLLLTQANAGSGLWLFIAATLMFPIGISPVALVVTGLVMSIAPPHRAGAAAAISETGAELGGALGIAVLGSVATAVYRTGMAAIALPGVDAVAFAPARATLGGAVALAAQLSGAQADQLLVGARTAFINGFHLVAWISLAIVLISAALAIYALRGAKMENAH